MASQEQQLRHLIASIYAAASDRSAWGGTLKSLGDLLGGASLVLSVIHQEQGLRFAETIRLDHQYDCLLKEQFNNAATNPLVAATLKLPIGRAQARSSIYSDKRYFGSALYQEVFRPQKLAHQAVACLARSDVEVMPLGILRSDHQGEFDADQFALLDCLLPHLRQALNLHLRLNELEAASRWQADMLDKLPFGVVMVSTRGHVMSINASAHAIIAQNDGLSCGIEGLCAAHSDDTRRLQCLIDSAVATGVGGGTHSGGAMLIPRPSRRRPLQLLVSPYRSTQMWQGLQQPAATVFITDPEHKPEHSTALLTRLYGFTPAEATLAAMLLHGASITEVADQLCVTHHTARTHLKSIFLKTGVKRQAELIRLLLLGPTQLLLDGTIGKWK